MNPIHIPGAEPPIPSPERIQACVVACNGIPTEQLVAMNAIEFGSLARAYDVCGDLWEWFGIEFVGEHRISAGRANEGLNDSKDDIEAVVAWARETGEKQ